LARSQIISLADSGKLAEANEAIDKFITDYAGNTGLDPNLLTIADSLTWRRLFTQAVRLYKYVQEKSADNSIKNKAGLGLARQDILVLIGQKKFSSAQEKVDSIIVNYKNEPDLSATLFQIGQEFCWQRRFFEAGEAFNKGIQLFPESSASKEMKLWLARVNVCALIWQAKDEQAVAEIDKMINDFNENPGLPEAIYRISKEFEWAKGAREDRTNLYDAPNSVYQKLIQISANSPFGQEAVLDQKRLSHRIKIFNLMKNGNQNEIDSAINNMASEISGKSELAGELLWVAIWYQENQKSMTKAREIFERIKRDCPGTQEADNAVLDIRRIDIDILYKADNDGQADLLLDNFIRDFNTNPYSGPCLKSLARGAYIDGEELEHLNQKEKAVKHFERAIRIWKTIVDKLPQNSSSTPESLYFIGEKYSRLGMCEDAIPFLKRVILEWPDYKFITKAETELAVCEHNIAFK